MSFTDRSKFYCLFSQRNACKGTSRFYSNAIPLSCLSSRHIESWFPTQQSNVTQNMKLNYFALRPAHSVVNRTERQQTECFVAGANRRNDSAFEHCPRWLHDITLVSDGRKIKAYGGMSSEQFSQVLS